MSRTVWQKVLVMGAMFVCLAAGSSQAFLFEIKPLNQSAIVTMNDAKLMDTYIDVMIELEAVNTFYRNAGFTPKEYGKYKTLLRFRTDLLIEIQKRKLDIPRIQ